MKRSRILPLLLLLCLAAISAQEPADDSSAISDELVVLYRADQADRSSRPTSEQWQEIGKRDAARLGRVKEIVGQGLLESAEDYFHAAMVLQHGQGADNILLAHVLSTVAGFKGHETGQWLAAASLDRFLQRVDRAQIFGTQTWLKEGAWTKEPFDRSLHETIREEYQVRAKKND